MAQGGEQYIFAYSEVSLDRAKEYHLERNDKEWIVSSFKKDSLKIPTRLISGPNGNYRYQLNHDEKLGKILTEEGTLVATVNLDKKYLYNITIGSGEVYTFRKLSGNQWNYYSDNNPVLVCVLKKEKKVHTIEMVSTNTNMEGHDALLLVSQVYGVDRIVAKRQSGPMWVSAIAIGVMTALVRSSAQ